MSETRIYLNVPFNDKNEVKRLGAKWDSEYRGWWIAPDIQRDPFNKWLPRMFRENCEPPHITCEMIPQSSWFANLRSMLPEEEWNNLRRAVYKQAGNCCRVCGQKGDKWPVECNEQWEYINDEQDPAKGIQKLLRLTALCPKCHSIKHMGLAHVQGREEEAINQLAYVNSWDEEQCHSHIEKAFELWERRSEMTWDFDLSVLPKYGIDAVYVDFLSLRNAKIYGVSVFPKNLTEYFNSYSLIGS